jgi:aldose 1-epimerase
MRLTSNDSLPSNADELKSFHLRNDSGFEVVLHNIGATIGSITVPAREGNTSVVLGHLDARQYLHNPYYLGSTIGRYANRIARARFQLERSLVHLESTEGEPGHCLHGGPEGFSHRFWSVDSDAEPQSVRLHLISPDGDQGFPGNVEALVTYRLLEGWKLAMEYRVTSDAPTVINLANHAYFNLNTDETPIDNHEVMINADQFTPIGDDMIPTGEKRDVSGSAFDFREASQLHDRLDAREQQIVNGHGFDHNFILNRTPEECFFAAQVSSPQSGLSVKIHTTQPGLQLYTGQHLGAPFQARAGVCLEAQQFPNAPNENGFPNTVLRPGEVYRQRTVYEFVQE